MCKITKKKIFLVSIQHTGTSFFCDLIKPDQEAHFQMLAHDTMDHDSAYVRLRKHFLWINNGKGISITDDHTVVCVVRKPEDTWQSWYNRGKHFKQYPVFQWYKSWEIFARVFNRVDYYLPIDHPDRINYLNRFEEGIGKKFYPNWDRKINAFAGPLKNAPEIDFTIPYSIPIIQELYG